MSTMSAYCMMNLLNTTTFDIEEQLEEFAPPYAMLSHCWQATEDITTYKDYLEARKAATIGCKRMAKFCGRAVQPETPGYARVVRFCKLARQLGFDWAWLEDPCVNKFNGTDVEVAINSVYRYYRNAGVCIAQLQDVVSTDSNWVHNSRWFDECWTLPALVASSNDVRFYDRDWNLISTKKEDVCIAAIEKRTGIPGRVLLDPEIIPRINVARRMAWASKRTTTRLEDVAYSLIGLFGVKMAPQYGEGRAAFERLQRAIIRKERDETIFAWTGGSRKYTGLLARSPADFADCGDVIQLLPLRYCSSVRITNDNAIMCANLRSTELHIPYGDGKIYAQELLCARTGDSSKFLDMNASLEAAKEHGFTQIFIALTQDPATKVYSRVATSFDISTIASTFGEAQECAPIQVRTEIYSMYNRTGNAEDIPRFVASEVQDYLLRGSILKGHALVVSLPFPAEYRSLVDHSKPVAQRGQEEGDTRSGAAQLQQRPPSYDTSGQHDWDWLDRLKLSLESS